MKSYIATIASYFRNAGIECREKENGVALSMPMDDIQEAFPEFDCFDLPKSPSFWSDWENSSFIIVEKN